MSKKELKTTKGHCPNCGPDRHADVVAEHSVPWDDVSGVWGNTDYRILQCRGCDAVYFQQSEVFSEDENTHVDPDTGEWEHYLPEKITHWPAPSKRDNPLWVFDLRLTDWALASLFDSIYVALNNDLRVLAAIGVRTAFDRASELLGVDPALRFDEKLTDLKNRGKIGDEEKEVLDALTDAGGAAAHRGWEPEPSELVTMMEILESFLHRSFVLGDAAKRLKAGVPARPKRKKAEES